MRELIESGRFGPLRLGMDRAQVESFLGAPDDWSAGARVYTQAVILKYGAVEFHFDPRDGGLWLIRMEEFEATSGGKSISLDPWVIGPSLTMSEMESCLSRNGIRYRVADQADWDDYKCLVAGAGVKLIFDGVHLCLSALSHSRIHAF